MNQRNPAIFHGDWLDLRAEADSRARSRELEFHLARHLQRARNDVLEPLVCVDLAGGSGNNVRHLAPRLPGAQHWKILDRDARLLDRALESCRNLVAGDGTAVRVDTHLVDLADPTEVLSESCRLLSASALLDLVSENWLDTLGQALGRRPVPVLFALTVNGHWQFIDSQGISTGDDSDEQVRSLFNAHQRRTKGMGQALGPDAGATAARILEQAGLEVRHEASSWKLPAGSRLATGLGRELVSGWADAAAEQAPEHDARIRQWLQVRLESLESGELGIEVGHDDLLALPPLRA